MVKITNWLETVNRSNELSGEPTNADSSLLLPTSVQDEMMIPLGSNLEPNINLSRISFNEEEAALLPVSKPAGVPNVHDLSIEAMNEAK